MKLEDSLQIRIINPLRKDLRNREMYASGDLEKSIDFNIKESPGEIEVSIVANDYIQRLQDGAEPNEIPIPTIAELTRWIDNKGLDLNPYAVQKSIIKQGTMVYRIGGTTVVSDVINTNTFKQIIKDITPDIKAKTKSEWQLLFKKNR